MAKRQVLRAEVHAMILERLTEGQWRPGERLGIDGLARDFEVSQTPVREALASLEQSGLIDYEAHRGYIVAPYLTPAQVGELIDARKVVEMAALSRAFRHWEAFVDDLRNCHAVHGKSTHSLQSELETDYSRVLNYFTADAEFHNALFRHSHNHYLSDMRQSLGWDAHRMRQTWSGGGAHVDAEDALGEHAAILACVEERNHDGALRALERHLENVRQRSGGTVVG